MPTCSQRRPSLLVLWPSTGSIVRPSVIGRRACTTPSDLDPANGLSSASWELSSVTNSCVGFTADAWRVLAAAVPVQGAASNRIPATSAARPAPGADHERTE